MGKRGRPPHPDILTPREWEVLALLRLGLSNPEIAERLGISRDGAKYHVSEILGKLGVESREQAARWQYEDAPPWWATAFVPFLPAWRRLSSTFGSVAGSAAKVVSIAVLAATLGGLGLLALLLFMQSDNGDSFAPTATPDAADPVLTFNTQSLPLPAQPERNSLFVIGADGEGLTELASADLVSNVQWAPDGERLIYRSVSNRISTLFLLDLKTGTTRDLVVAQESGRAIDYLWAPDGERIVALIGNTARVVQLDGTEIASFEATDLVEWSPDGRYLLVFEEDAPNRAAGTLYLVEPGTWERVLLTPARRSSYRYADWSPDGSAVSFLPVLQSGDAAGCPQPAGLAIIDLEESSPEQVLSVCTEITSHSWAPQGDRIAFNIVSVRGVDSNGLRILDLADRSVTQLTEDIDFSSVWLPSGEVLAVRRANCWGCDGGAWWVLVDEDGTELAEWLGNRPALGTHDSDDVVVLGTTDGQLHIVDASGDVTAAVLDQAPYQFLNVALSPDGAQIAFVRWQGFTDTTYIASLVDEEWQGLVLPTLAYGVKLSPDWQRVAYILDRQIVVANADGSNARAIADDVFTTGEALEWAPSGSHIAFLRRIDSDRVELAVVDADGGQVRVLRDMGSGEQAYVWSPDSEQLLLFEGGRDLNNLTIISINSGEEMLVVDGGATSKASWSPDGSYIAYAGVDEVRVVRIETGDEVALLNLEGRSHIGVPAWSPDGEAVAIASYDYLASETKIELFERDGTLRAEVARPLQLAEGRSFALIFNRDHFPVWSPTGDRIYMNFLSANGLGHGISMLDLNTMEISDLTFTERTDYRHVIMSVSPDGSQLAFRSDWCFGSC